MKVIDIGVGKLGVAYAADEVTDGKDVDAILLADAKQGEIDLRSEITGGTAFAANMAALSLECSVPILCGGYTRYGEVRHVSVLTFAGGRLADVADRTRNLGGGTWAESDTVKVLRFKKFDLGVLVDTDILLAAHWQRIVERCDAVACIAMRSRDIDFGYIPTLSSLFGMPYAVAFTSGELLWGDGE